MCKVSCLIQHFRYPEVSNLNLILTREEHIDRLNVSMQYLVRMQILYSKAHFKEEFPDALL